MYTYTFFDGNPASSGPCSWPSHEDVELEADDAKEAVRFVRDTLEGECAALAGSDDYPEGTSVWAMVWDEAGMVVGQFSHEVGEP